MLQTIAVSGYRSLRDVVVPLGGLTVVTGANGTGKSNLYRALRLLAGAATGGMVDAVAREGGLSSLLWAGPEHGGGQGPVRRNPVAVRLGFASDELRYLVDLGLPQTDGRRLFSRDPEIKREQVFAGAVAKPSTLLIDRRRSATRVREDAWIALDQSLAPFESILVDLADGDTGPELLALRRTLAGWRFYDHFRVDAEAPARSPQVGTRTREPGPLIVLNEPEASLHESLLDPLAQLIVSASRRTQVIVVTHAAELARRLEDAGALAHRLVRTADGTVVEGQGFLDVPAWNWGSR